MGLLDLFFRKAAPIVDPAALAGFLDQRAAFMAQKGVYEYSRARSGVLSSKLFKEPAFRAALEEARWRNYPYCLQSAALMAEHALRGPAGAEAAAMRNGLIAVVGEVCLRYPTPPALQSGFWPEAAAQIARRIELAGLAAPHAIKDIPHEIGDKFLANLPIHASLRTHDRELVTNNLRVNLCRAYEEFLAAAALPALARALAAAAAAPRPGR